MPVRVPRKYDTLINFLKDTITNPSISHRVRFAAAERLDNLYARHEIVALQALRRQEREAKAGAAAVQGQGEPVGAADTPEPASENTKTKDRHVRDVFDRVLNRGNRTVNTGSDQSIDDQK
jgi:hypothetical protein